MTPATIQIQQLVQQNTFDEILITLTDGAQPVPNPIDLTGAIITFTARQFVDGPIVLTKDNDTIGGVTITNAAGGVFRIDKIQNFNLPESKYISDILFVFPNGDRRTYLRLDIDVTYKVTA